MPDIFVMIA